MNLDRIVSDEDDLAFREKIRCRWCLTTDAIQLDELGYCSNACRARAGVPPETFMRGRNWIHTFTGRQFWPMEARGEVVVEDIAHHLAMECRYSGACARFYSVAEHSVRVAEILRRRDYPAPVCLLALLHDASEAYLKDVPRPLKITPAFAAYREAEEKLQGRIEAVFGVRGYGALYADAVKDADRAVYGFEVRRLFATIPSDQLTDLPRDFAMDELPAIGWGPSYSEEKFLEQAARYSRLSRLVLP